MTGEVAFRLYDTYGFPLDLTEDFLSSEELTLDRAGFDRAMEEQRTRAREDQKGTVYLSAGLTDLRSTFVGDRIVEWESEVLAALSMVKVAPVQFAKERKLKLSPRRLLSMVNPADKLVILAGSRRRAVTLLKSSIRKSRNQV